MNQTGKIIDFDARRQIFIGANYQETIMFAAENWVHMYERAVQQKGTFHVALSGGSTPKAIFEIVTKKDIDWSKVYLYWSDERSVNVDHPDSNYRMAMQFFSKVAIPQHQIFRMHAESEIEKNARNYEEIIKKQLDKNLFDLVMLGVGEDGHTASLFPNTKALESIDRLVVENFIPEKKTYRMTFTFDCINNSRHTVIYALGSSKAQIVPEVLFAAIRSKYPCSMIGTEQNKSLWILDLEAAKNLDFSL